MSRNANTEDFAIILAVSCHAQWAGVAYFLFDDNFNDVYVPPSIPLVVVMFLQVRP